MNKLTALENWNWFFYFHFSNTKILDICIMVCWEVFSDTWSPTWWYWIFQLLLDPDSLKCGTWKQLIIHRHKGGPHGNYCDNNIPYLRHLHIHKSFLHTVPPTCQNGSRIKVQLFNSSSPGTNGCHFGRQQFEVHFLKWKLQYSN